MDPRMFTLPVRAVLATRNAHKVQELREIIGPMVGQRQLLIVGLDDFPDAPEVVEDGITFEENALLKARAIAKHTQLPALADDSGLAVDVLGGCPGIFSARWSGGKGDVANYELLLAQLGDVKDEHRSAAFMCAAAIALPDGREAVQVGSIPGWIAREPKGTNGFGYDPVFVPEGDSRHFAEYAAAEKNEISHRARAFGALGPELEQLLGQRS